MKTIKNFRLFHNACATIPALLLSALLCTTYTVVAQNKTVKSKPNVRLANESNKNIQVKTLLANPKMVSAKSSCEVTSFTISFLPEGGEIFGPFKTEGASIMEKQIGYIKAHANENVKIFIEDIHMSCNGKDVTEQSIVVTSFP
jgi:hypothetical protein